MKRGDREEARGGECLREMATGEKYRRLLKLPTQRRGPTSGAKRPGRQKAITLSSWSEFKAVRQQVISQRGRARQAAGGGGELEPGQGEKHGRRGTRGEAPIQVGEVILHTAGREGCWRSKAGLEQVEGSYGTCRKTCKKRRRRQEEAARLKWVAALLWRSLCPKLLKELDQVCKRITRQTLKKSPVIRGAAVTI